MRIAFIIIWTFGISFFFGYYYATTYHKQPSVTLTMVVAFASWFSGMGIVYFWHKAKKDSDNNNNTPSSWL